MDIETIDRGGLERAQKVLLPKLDSGLRGGDEQREFLRLVKDDAGEFCAHLRTWGLTAGETPPVIDDRLSEKEFLDPSWSTECLIAATWRELPVRLAARPETWVRVHVELIEQEMVESSYLAAGNRGQPGHTQIAQALRRNNPKKVDDCVRSVLRRLGGIVSYRGNRTAFLDCPIARAWWRNRYAQEAHQVFNRHSPKALSRALRKPFRWERLVEDMVSRLTVIGDNAIRPALVQCLADGIADSAEEMERLTPWVGRRSTLQALGALGSQHVLDLVTQEFAPSPDDSPS